MDLATYLSTTAEGNYTASIGNYTSSDMISYLVGVFHSKSINASNKTRINNPEVDALIDKASTTLDETSEKRDTTGVRRAAEQPVSPGASVPARQLPRLQCGPAGH